MVTKIEIGRAIILFEHEAILCKGVYRIRRKKVFHCGIKFGGDEREGVGMRAACNSDDPKRKKGWPEERHSIVRRRWGVSWEAKLQISLGFWAGHEPSYTSRGQRAGLMDDECRCSPFSSLVPGGISLRRRFSRVRISAAHWSNVALEMDPTGTKRIRK